MTQRIVHDPAVADLNEILDYPAMNAGKAVALRYAMAFQKAFDRIVEFPASGAPRPKLGPDTRLVIVQPYLIFYDYLAAQDSVHVLRILHSRRNITKLSLKP